MTADSAAFANVLREAVARSGFSLAELRRMLEAEQAPVSAAALSYWQSGRSVPSKPKSLAAVAVLEKVLQLDRGQLSSLLPLPGSARDTCGPGREGPDSWQQFLEIQEVPKRAAEAVSTSLEREPFRRLSTHVEAEYDALGTFRGYTRRLTIVATEDGVERLVVWVGGTSDDAFLVVRPIYNCRTGRTIRQEGGVITELFLDRPLRTGEIAVVESRCEVIGASVRETEAVHGVLGDVGELVMHVRFDPACVPAVIERFSVAKSNAERSPARVVDAQATAVFLRPGLGHHGLKWQW